MTVSFISILRQCYDCFEMVENSARTQQPTEEDADSGLAILASLIAQKIRTSRKTRQEDHRVERQCISPDRETPPDAGAGK
jgi:hypothetical protein